MSTSHDELMQDIRGLFAAKWAIQVESPTLDLEEHTRRRAEINPVRVLDDKRPELQAQLDDAPLMVDHLSDSTRARLADPEALTYVNEFEVRGRVGKVKIWSVPSTDG